MLGILFAFIGLFFLLPGKSGTLFLMHKVVRIRNDTVLEYLWNHLTSNLCTDAWVSNTFDGLDCILQLILLKVNKVLA